MAMQWRNGPHGMFQQSLIRETQWAQWTNIPIPKTPLRRPHSVCSKSSTESMSSSSSWTSSQESLNVYGTSLESPHMIGGKAQDRLRRIRENYNYQQSMKMEIDEKVVVPIPAIFPVEKLTKTQPISDCHSPMTIDSDIDHSHVENTVRSVSLRFKRFRQALSKPTPINQRNDNTQELPSNLYRHPNSKERINNNHFQSLSNYQNTPRWMIPSLTAKPLRRPHIFHHQIEHTQTKFL